MSDWHHDMSTAPRGKFRLQPTGKGNGTRKVLERAEIVVAGACGVVAISYWIDAERRWSMFTSEVPPIAWMKKPEPVEVMGRDGKPRLATVLPAHPTMAESWFQDWLSKLRAAA